jgi:seryl-tRNA synthetase
LISIELIRSDPDRVREAMARRGENVPIDEILELDVKRRNTIVEADELRARRNEVSKEMGRSKERPAELIEEMRGVGGQIKTLEDTLRSVEDQISALVMTMPNLPQDDVPFGKDESDNIEVKRFGEIPTFDFQPKPHWEIGEDLDIIDFERGAKMSGSRFFVLKGKGARLQRALIDWMLDLHTEQHGYTEIYLPNMVTAESAIANSNLPKFEDTMYHDSEDDLWLLPTAEMALTNLHRDEILPPGSLPLAYVAHTPCFRRERTAAGRDTRGIKRVHQFEKVEMYKFVDPDRSDAELDKIIADAGDVCSKLGLTYRLLQLCTADISFQSSKTYDLEIWAPGSDEWQEVSSCSNCTDFQARRASIRYRPEQGTRPRFPHTLNGSGIALPRAIIGVLENYQLEDGSVLIPEVLQPYTNFSVISR